jgi:hypothetical protein
MKTRTAIMFAGAFALLSACDVTLTQRVSPSDLDLTERSAFTSDGRLFVIGARSSDKLDAGNWIVEVTKSSSGQYLTVDYVFGALEGAEGGVLGGKPLGAPCSFSGMAAHGQVLYAACFSPDDMRSSLFQVDTQAGTVRAGYFPPCDPAASKTACSPFYANGMAVDAQGRIYVSNTYAHISLDGENVAINVEGSHSLTQIIVGPNPALPEKLVFETRDWFDGDIFTDGVAPNGVQIENQVLYYAAGPNINAITIGDDGTAGDFRVHYRGPLLSYIDDFAVLDGRMALARTFPPAIVGLDRPSALGIVRELGTSSMSLDAIPSSVSYQADIPVGASLFPKNSLVVTCYFGGGLYDLSGL